MKVWQWFITPTLLFPLPIYRLYVQITFYNYDRHQKSSEAIGGLFKRISLPGKFQYAVQIKHSI